VSNINNKDTAFRHRPQRSIWATDYAWSKLDQFVHTNQFWSITRSFLCRETGKDGTIMLTPTSGIKPR